MRRLSDEKRRLSLQAADQLGEDLAPRLRREITAGEIADAIETGDPHLLRVVRFAIQQDLEHGSLTEISRSLDLLAETARANKEAGSPLKIEMTPVGFQHTQRVLELVAHSRTELAPPYGVNKAQVCAEVVGRLKRMGILEMDDEVHNFAAPILRVLKNVSPFAAFELERFVNTGQGLLDHQMPLTAAELHARKAESQTANSKLDADIGGKKPASKHGSMTWRPSRET